jgi:predicted signal transduction protein with EAL and GGDEF domain
MPFSGSILIICTNLTIAGLNGAKFSPAWVVAEGVETQEELAFLQAHHCDQAQGYYFSRPVLAPQFAELLETQSARSALSPSGPFARAARAASLNQS